MASPTKISITLAIGLFFTAFQTFNSHPSKADEVESAKIASTVPIADLHDHDGYAVTKGHSIGVYWAGLGSKEGGRTEWMFRKKNMGYRNIAWAGQFEFNWVYLFGDIDEMLNPDNPTLVQLYKDSEKDLKDGVIVGIGEIFINNQSNRRKSRGRKLSRKGQVDAPIFRKFFDLVAQYDGFLAFHMEGDPDSREELSKLLASNRKGRVLWNHCGSNTDPSDVRSMMDKHPNLFCELSFRYPPMNENDSREIFWADGIDSSWRELMEDHSDRFMIGTDAHSDAEFVESIRVVRKGLLPNLMPDTARKIAYQNAQRLFGFKDYVAQASSTENLDEEATAKKLIEEFGEMATMDAMMKAEEAAGKGDEKGKKFWMRVHGIAIKLTGG